MPTTNHRLTLSEFLFIAGVTIAVLAIALGVFLWEFGAWIIGRRPSGIYGDSLSSL
jgi:hypothetical protein